MCLHYIVKLIARVLSPCYIWVGVFFWNTKHRGEIPTGDVKYRMGVKKFASFDCNILETIQDRKISNATWEVRKIASPDNFLSNFCVFLEKRSLSNYRYCADRAKKSARASPPFGPHFLDFVQIGSFSTELFAERVKTVLTRSVFRSTI